MSSNIGDTSPDNLQDVELQTAPVEAVHSSDEQERVETYKDSKEQQPENEGNCVYWTLAAIILIVGVVIIVIMLVVVKEDNDKDANSSNTAPSDSPPTLAPTQAVPLVEDAQQRLDMLTAAIANNPATSVAYSHVPAIVSDLQDNTDTNDPAIQAAKWSVLQDPFPAEREIVQRFALATLYFTTDGPNWIEKGGWFADQSICNGWEGLRCCRDYHIELDPHQCNDKEGHHMIELELSNNNLQGTIPPAISLLDYLEILWLDNNRLTGPLDATIFANMPHLDSLYVHENQLSGGIDLSIRDNGHLDTLFAHYNDFNGTWPASFCPTCKAEGLCDHEPISFTLDCEEITCPTGCCSSQQSLQHCYGNFRADDGSD